MGPFRGVVLPEPPGTAPATALSPPLTPAGCTGFKRGEIKLFRGRETPKLCGFKDGDTLLMGMCGWRPGCNAGDALLLPCHIARGSIRSHFSTQAHAHTDKHTGPFSPILDLAHQFLQQ